MQPDETRLTDEPEHGCYVYGIVCDDRRPAMDGVSGVGSASVDFVRSGTLAAVVADVARSDFPQAPLAPGADAEWLEAAVRAHEAVLERCLAHGPVLPMRFATTFRTAADVQDLLDRRGAQFESVLARLGDRCEWGVKALLERSALADWVRSRRPDLLAAETTIRAKPAGTAYLAQKRLHQEIAAVGAEAVQVYVAAAHERLARASVETRLLSLPHTQPTKSVCLNAAYLVEASAEDAFRVSVEELNREHAPLGLRYELSGAWPAYNFVPSVPT